VFGRTVDPDLAREVDVRDPAPPLGQRAARPPRELV